MHLKNAKLCALVCTNHYSQNNFVYDIYHSTLTQYNNDQLNAFSYVVDLFIGINEFVEGDEIISLQTGNRYKVAKVISDYTLSVHSLKGTMFDDDLHIVENINFVKILGAPSKEFIRKALEGNILPEDEVIIDMDNLYDRHDRVICRSKVNKKYSVGLLKTKLKLFAQQIYGDRWNDTHEIWFEENFK